MRKIDAYVTEDDTLFRVEADAKKHENKQKLEKKLKEALFFFDDIIGGVELYNFIKKNRDLVMEILVVDYAYLARWQAENK